MGTFELVTATAARRWALLVALFCTALVGLPATSGASPDLDKVCAVTPQEAFVVKGTLVHVIPDDPTTPALGGSVTLTVTDTNRHARDSGEIADQDPTVSGVQVEGAFYTVPDTDSFVLILDRYEGSDTPSPGDAVHVRGTIAYTDRRCAPAGTSLADRYGAVDVADVTMTDSDADV